MCCGGGDNGFIRQGKEVTLVTLVVYLKARSGLTVVMKGSEEVDLKRSQ